MEKDFGPHWADTHSGSTKSVRVEIPRSQRDARHTAMSFKERIAEARRDKAGRKSEQAKKRKKALARKKTD